MAWLTDEQLQQLRNEITLGSMYYDDYENSLGIDSHAVCDFFDGYLEYCYEIMEEDGLNPEWDDVFEKYDNIDEISTYYNYMFDEDPLPITELDESYKKESKGKDPYETIKQNKDHYIQRLSKDWEGTPKSSWEDIFENVFDEFTRYADDEVSDFILDKFDNGEITADDVDAEFDNFLTFWIDDINEYDIFEEGCGRKKSKKKKVINQGCSSKEGCGSKKKSTKEGIGVGVKDSGKYYELVDYFDVWGNEEDGWEVNNQTVWDGADDIYMSADTTETELIDYLKSIRYLDDNVKESDLYIDWGDGDFIEIFKADDMMPICSLRLNEYSRK